MSWAERLVKWIEPEDNPRNTIYGALAAGFVIAAVDPARETYVRVTTATLIAVATYWLAHGYAHWVDQRFRATTHMGGSIRSVGSALSHEWPLAEGAAIPFATLLIAWAAGAPLTTGVPAALATAAAALVLFEIAAGLRRRLPPWQLLANAAIGLALGAALFTVKLLLH